MLLQMSRKQQMLATIAARASTPPERLQTDYECCLASSDDAVQRRQQRLEEMLGTSSEEALVRFYAQAYPHLESITQLLSSVQLFELQYL